MGKLAGSGRLLPHSTARPHAGRVTNERRGHIAGPFASFRDWRRLCVLLSAFCGAVTSGSAAAQENTVNIPHYFGDLNGDGRDDVLLRHTDGRWYYYPMNGREPLDDGQGGANLTGNLDWQFAGMGDLNGDGRDDVLVRRVTDGRWYYYPMDGRRHLLDQRGGMSLTSDLAWQFAGTGDLDGDGKDDVLLRHRDDGRWLYYPMDGRTHITGGRGLANIPRELVWQLAGIGDLNGDGNDDVLLRHTNGTWQYFPMNGRDYLRDQRGAAFLTSNLEWQFAGIGDLNGDGKDDVLLRHVATGRWYYYPMDGRRHITSGDGGANIVSDLAWQMAGIGDLNGDGKDDVLLRHRDDGRWLYYPMDGREYIAGGRGTAGITRDLAWSADVIHAPPPTRPPPTNAMTALGQFKDANVQGLTYVSGGQSGYTTERGEFTYETSNGRPGQVTFSVGNVSLGTTAGKSIITPLDLPPADNFVGPEFFNITRFLLLLDGDADPINGIAIPADVRSLAAGWPQVDFSLEFGAFDSSPAVTRILSDVASVVNGAAPAMPDPTFAATHLSNTLYCIYAGIYQGTVSGDRRGNLTLAVVPTGQVFGYAGELSHFIMDWSEYNFIFDVVPGSRVRFNKTIPATGTLMTGQFPSPDEVSGEWRNDSNGTRGRFSGRRIGGDPRAIYRWVAGFDYSDGTLGLLLDVDENGGVTGRGYEGHRHTYFNATGPAGTFTIHPDGAMTMDFKAITFDPVPTDVHVLQLGAGIHAICRLN